MTSISGELKRLHAYQKVRFPLLILIPSLIPAIVSSGAVLMSNPSFYTGIFALAASVLYLFHIRVLDEKRDFEHDNEHHTDRPVQTGIISLRGLQIWDYYAIGLLAAIALLSGAYAIVVCAAMLGYSYLAEKEFFLGERLRSFFFLYNALNVIQMFLMQLFVYMLLAPFILFTPLIGAHFLFTSAGTSVFEFARKIKIPGEDGTGKDTYTWYLGFTRAIGIYLLMAFLTAAFFLYMLSFSPSYSQAWPLYVAVAYSVIALVAFVHLQKKKHTTDGLMQLSFVSLYAAANLIIYFVYA